MTTRHRMEPGDDSMPIGDAHRPGAMYMRAEARRTAESAGLVTASEPQRRRRSVRRTQLAVLGGAWLLIAVITILVGLWWPRRGETTTARVEPAETATVAKAADAPTPAAAPTPIDRAKPVEAPVAVATATKPAAEVRPVAARRSVPAAVTGGPSRLVITSSPAGAVVTVDGVGWGATPARIPYLPPGTKRVRVTKDGYASQETSIRVAGGTTTLNVALRRLAPRR